jgi:hypothetical protein
LTTEQGRETLEILVRTILDEQFDISYYIKGMTYTDTENMAVFERKQIYRRLIKRKSEEKEAAEESHKNANKIQVKPQPKPSRRNKR